MSEIDELKKLSDRLNGRVNDIESTVADVSNFRDPRNTQARFDSFQQQFEEMNKVIESLKMRLTIVESFIREYRDMGLGLKFIGMSDRVSMIERWIANDMEKEIDVTDMPSVVHGQEPESASDGAIQEIAKVRRGRPPKQKNETVSI